MIFKVYVETVGHELYEIDAETPSEAQQIFEDGDAGRPVIAEVLDATVDKVEAPD